MALRRAARPRRSPPVRRAATATTGPGKALKSKVVIVGFGRVGGALALGLTSAGWAVTVFPRGGASLRRAVALGLKIADLDSLREADVCVLAVPDAAVTEVAQQVLLDLGLSTALVHCAGALPLSAFGPLGARRPRGSFHPLVAVSDAEDPLADHAVAISASTRPLLQLLRKMASELHLHALEVPEDRRAAYHAGAVLAAGGVAALLASAVGALGEAGIAEDEALAALLPLSRSALRGIEQRGLSAGLTGPVRRGDVAVVASHLEALPPELGALYRLLSRRALALCEQELPEQTRRALERLLFPSFQR
jgi:predicted short-subunit dehydrogenase-like oxidoreductase (DUF2520 family)